MNDSNCIDFSKIRKFRYPYRLFDHPVAVNWKRLKVGVVKEFDIEELDERNRSMQTELLKLLKDKGAEIVPVSMPLVKYSLPFYFTLVPSEASSNLARYDGLKYGHQFDF